MLRRKGVRVMYKIFISALVGGLIVTSCAGVPKLKKSTSASKSSVKTEKVAVQPTFRVSKKTAAAYNAALKHMRTKNYAVAISEMKKVASMDKRISGPWVNIGLAHKELAEPKKAKVSFEKALSINPNNPYALNHLAIMHREEGEFNKAEGFYKKALSAHPDYQNAHLNLGILCELYLRKIDCAVEHYQQYLKLSGGQDKQVTAWVAQLKKQGS